MFNSNFVLVDTNVPIVANDSSVSEYDLDCVEASKDALKYIISNCIVVLDSDGIIFNQYKRYFNSSGQPGIGDRFFRWILLNQGNPSHSDFVLITQQNEYEYDQYPTEPEFATFHRKDKIFVAVAVHSAKKPSIINATDSDWQTIEEALFRIHSVKVENLCPNSLKSYP
jgi:hypothetical protein